MLSEHIEGALGGPLTAPALEEIARTVWRAVEKGALSWDEADRLDGLIRERRARMRAAGGWGSQGGAGGLRPASAALGGSLGAAARRSKRPRNPEREASLGRRLAVTLSGAIPSAVAKAALARGGRLTGGHVAVLSVVGREAARGRDGCRWPIARIAVLAGVARSTVQRALRLAESLGLIRVRQRRHRGAKSDTNVVTIEDAAWWRWLRRGPKQARKEAASRAEGGDPGGVGCQPCGPTDTEELRRGRKAAAGASQNPPQGGCEGAGERPEGASGGPRAPRGASCGGLRSPRTPQESAGGGPARHHRGRARGRRGWIVGGARSDGAGAPHHQAEKVQAPWPAVAVFGPRALVDCPSTRFG